MNNIDPDKCDKSPLDESDPVKRMQKVLRNAKKLGVDTAATADDLANGNPEVGGLFLGELYNAYANPFNENEKLMKELLIKILT